MDQSKNDTNPKLVAAVSFLVAVVIAIIAFLCYLDNEGEWYDRHDYLSIPFGFSSAVFLGMAIAFFIKYKYERVRSKNTLYF